MKFKLLISAVSVVFFTLISSTLAFANDRIALIIGNSNYQNLGTLANTKNDAIAIENRLKSMGYKTRLAIDLNESQSRKEIRNFALDSESASIAILFYAGHGAQVFGENYLLPIDLDMPRRESDIQLSGLKVDDIVNSIHSKVKVVFLDACRDNPALVRSLSKGRGSYPVGLAPAKNSSLNDSSGVFIAYATDSGNVALDGNEQKNSPFTTALVKYIQQPISIDDMFSKVTKEVREQTKNAQRPYKYASIEGVVCLSGKCGVAQQSSATELSPRDIKTQNVGESKFRIAIDYREVVNNPHSESSFNSADLPSTWVMFGVDLDDDGKANSYWYMNPSSISKVGNNITVRIKSSPVSSNSKSQKRIIELWTFNCLSYKAGQSEFQEFDSDENVIKDSKFRDPEFTDLNTDFKKEGSVGHGAVAGACSAQNLIPFNNEQGLDWYRLFTTSEGEREADYYYSEPSLVIKDRSLFVLIKESFKKEQKLSSLGSYSTLKGLDTVNFKERIMLTEVKCDSVDYTMWGEQLYDTGNQLINYEFRTSSFKSLNDDSSTFLRRKYCK